MFNLNPMSGLEKNISSEKEILEVWNLILFTLGLDQQL